MYTAGWAGLGTRLRLELYDSGPQAGMRMHLKPVRVTGSLQ